MNNKIMGRKCNLELGLVTPSCDDHHTLGDICQHQPMIGEVTHWNPREEHQEKGTQKLTIFYNGRVSSCDVTEIQARSIISVASEEILVRDQKEAMTPTCSETSSESSPKPRVMYKQQNTGLSMKRSLQQFLHKRRTRIRSSPYCTP